MAEGLAARRKRESQEKKPDQTESPKDKAPQKHQAQVQGKAVDDWIVALKDPNTAIRKQAAELLTDYVETQAGKLSTETKLHDALMNARYSDKDAAVRAAAGVGYQLIYFDPKSRSKTRAHVESQFKKRLREETAHVADTEPKTRPSLRGGGRQAGMMRSNMGPRHRSGHNQGRAELAEMVIKGKRRCDLELVHDDFGSAIREAPFLVGVSSKGVPGEPDIIFSEEIKLSQSALEELVART